MRFKKTYLLFILICLMILLSSCKDNHQLNMIVPYGSPEYATLFLSELDHYNVDVVNGADPLIAAFGSDQYDVIVAPTNLGAKFYQSSKDYVLTASIVWGNYYLISNHPIDVSSLDNETIYTFGQNQTPDIVLKYVLSDQGVNATLTYLTSTIEISAQFLQSPADIYMIAEPALSQLVDSYEEDIYTIDLQLLYQIASGQDSYPQASVFVKSTLDQALIDQLNSDLATTISSQLNNEENVTEIAALLDTDLDLNTLRLSIARSRISYVSAQHAKSAIEAYFQIILDQNPALIGGSLPESDFYR